MQIRDYMTAPPTTANLRDGLRQTWDRMQERRVRHMPVLDDDGRLVGIISERDLRRPSSLDEPNLTHLYALDNNTLVEEAMTPEPKTLREDVEFAVARDLFIQRRFGAVPVMDMNDRLIGILSIVDMLRACADQHKA